MPDPIQIERNFQELVALFDSIPSIRHRHKLFFDFADTLNGEFKKYESYILQLLDDLPFYSSALSWSGIDPDEIEADLSMFEQIHSHIDVSEKSDHYYEIKRNLQEVCLLLYSCLNDPEKADYYLRKVTGLSWTEKSSFEDPEGESQQIYWLFEKLSTELKRNRKRSTEQQQSLERLHKQVTDLIDNKAGSILIPVAEKYGSDQTGKCKYGRLRKMSVELYGVADSKSRDELIWMTNIYGAEIPSINQTVTTLDASRKLFASGSKTMNSGYYRGGVQFENNAALHDGNSANLGIAALWYSILLKTSGLRERYSVYSNVAITGDIDQNGSVKPVDETSIPLKAKAVFFSWAKIFVIPDSQRGLFEAEIKKLQKRYPDRSLDIIGITHLREIFYDRRVAMQDVQGRIPYLLNRLKNEHSKFILIPAIIVLLLIVVRLMYGPIDRNAVFLEFTNNHIVLMNQLGNVIQRIESNESTRGTHSVSKPNAILHDLTGDGKNELIYSNRTISAEEGDPKLRIWSVTGDSLIWEDHLTLNYEFPRQSAPYVSELRPLEVRVANSAEGKRIVVHTGSSQYFQGVVFVYSAENGDLLSEYVHTGQIRDMMILDLNEDNEDEIIITGVNNAFWQAFVAVLDISNAHGYSPATLDYRPVGIERANEKIYARIPKTIIGKYVEFIDKYNQGRSMFFDDTSDVLTILVVEGWRHFNNLDGYVDILLYFDRSMNPVGVGTSDVYDVTVKKLYEEGEIEQMPDFDYFEAYQDSILYWNGEEFLKTNEFFDSTEQQIESR